MLGASGGWRDGKGGEDRGLMLRISPAPVIKVVNCSPAPGHTSRKTTQGLLLAFPPALSQNQSLYL